MARIPLLQNSIRREMPSGARFRAADFGPGIAATALGAAGKAMGDVAEKVDEIEQVNARVEANRLSIEHSELSRQIGNRVKQTLGENATGAADLGATDLEAATKEILGRASPRARLLLEGELGQRMVVAKDGFADHGFGQKVKAFEETSAAKINSIGEAAADEDDEERGLALLQQAVPTIDEQARFFGKGDQWATEEKRRVVSGYFKSRSLKLAIGPNGSALAAIEYATKHRAAMTDQDYNAVVSSYNDNALDEVATSEMYGNPQSNSVVRTEADGQQSPRQLDPKAFISSWVLPIEGGYGIDNDGAEVNMGINKRAHPNENVKGMTVARATEIYTKQYYFGSGADKLPPALAAVHMDTYIMGQKGAARILKASGGDVDRYMALRKEWQQSLAANDPKKFPPAVMRGWANRNDKIMAYASRLGGDGTAPAMAITESTSMTDVTASTMARTDIGLALKTKIIAMADRRRGDLRQERVIKEQDAYDGLTTAAMGLGEGFTDIKQLPQNVWLSASPQAQATFTNMAKANRENKPLSPELTRYIEFTEVSDPRKFASKEFLAEIQAKGVPQKVIQTIAARQGQIAGSIASLKPDPISSGEVWTVAKPAFEAAGLLFDTIEAKGAKGKAAENHDDTVRKNKAVGFLRDMAVRWAQANPGKKPDENTIRQWVGYSLRNTSRGRGFELDDTGFYDRIEPAQRQTIAREFIKLDPSWARKPVAERIRDVVAAARDRAATGR